MSLKPLKMNGFGNVNKKKRANNPQKGPTKGPTKPQKRANKRANKK